MQQGSREWLDFRKDKIGASEAPIIMGVSPWSNPLKLWEKKVFEKDDEQKNWYMEMIMQKALLAEEAARSLFFLLTGHSVSPAVFVSKYISWMMASLDGISDDGSILLEIKCPGEKDHSFAREGKIPDKYYPQLQHQLAVLGLDKGYYLSYKEDNILDCHLIEFKRDESYIIKLIEKEKEFYECVQTFTPPKVEKKVRLSRAKKWKALRI